MTKHDMRLISVEDAANTDFTEKRTDRQERISWWKQSALRKGRALVVGAGAIGNELLKNLALMGFGYVYVCDMDHISSSNLSRTVLFTAEDIGKQKSVTAAKRYLEMCVEPLAAADVFDGDICAQLGSGVFNHVDVVIGCLDNLQTRFEVSRRCNLMKVPYIDAGIKELDWQLTSAHYPETGCWACSMSQKLADAAVNRERNSCDVTKKKNVSAGHVPTVQVASSMVAGLQAQEVVKHVTHSEWKKFNPGKADDDPSAPPMARFGGTHRFIGLTNELFYTPFRPRASCYDHFSYDQVIPTGISADWTLRQVFDYVRERFGGYHYLSLRGDSRYQKAAFVTTGRCRCCGKPIGIYKSQKVLTDADLYCDDCDHVENMLSGGIEKVCFYDTDDDVILDRTLLEIGVPRMHVIELYDEDDPTKMLALELTADMPAQMPELWKRENESK